MGSLKKRNNHYSIVFKPRFDGRPVTKTCALGTRYKKVAQQKKLTYDKFCESGQINLFTDKWNLQAYERVHEPKGYFNNKTVYWSPERTIPAGHQHQNSRGAQCSHL